MYINEIEIENYKCFKAKVSLKLAAGINCIIGQNNAGKTSVLEALSARFLDAPHLDMETYANVGRGLISSSTISFTFTISHLELRNELSLKALNSSRESFEIPEIEVDDVFDDDGDLVSKDDRIVSFLNSEQLTLRIFKLGSSTYNDVWNMEADAYVSPPLVRARIGATRERIRGFSVSPAGEISLSNNSSTREIGDYPRYEFPIKLGTSLQKAIYRFNAERIPFGPCALGNNSLLDPDARNLAEVLSLLNPAQMNRFNELVRGILPSVSQVSVSRTGDDTSRLGQVKVWNMNDAVHIDDLGFTLDKCGSGVGQVLAILYVTSRVEPKIILIDEPQSFLHPNAARKLIETIRQIGSHHQIVIATHSPAMISLTEPTTVSLVTQNDGKSSVSEIDVDEFQELQIVLSDLGGRFSDVFGYDQIVWVEGETEELCFPKIARKYRTLLGTAILRVRSTGDFGQRDKNRVEHIMETYMRLSNADNTLVPSLNDFVFDSDIFTAAEQQQMEKLGKRLQNRKCVHFLPRPMFENYLLVPEAIAAVINDVDSSRNSSITSEEVAAWIGAKTADPRFRLKGREMVNGKEWFEVVHGKRVLQAAFEDLVETEGLPYSETTHGVKLTDWILEYAPHHLVDISDLLEDLIRRSKA
jgi:predicted ATPase